MSEHPNVQRLRDGYDAFSRGDFPALDELIAEDVRWHSTGRNQLSGTYEGRSAVYDLLRRVVEVTEGSFRAEIRTVFADDTDAVVVLTTTGRRGQVSTETLDAHLWRFRDGRAIEFWLASTDMHAMDELFG